MILDKLENEMRENLEQSDVLTEIMHSLKAIKAANDKNGMSILSLVQNQIDAGNRLIASKSTAGALSFEDKRKSRAILSFWEQREKQIRLENKSDADNLQMLKTAFDEAVSNMKQDNAKIQSRLHNVFAFSEVAFMDGNEMTVLVTELTVNAYSSRFIGIYGSPDYQKHNEDLMLHERQDDIIREIEQLEL